MDKVDYRLITVRFTADVSSSMQWNFKPQQTEVKVSEIECTLQTLKLENPAFATF